MFRPLRHPPASRPVTGRRGAILIVVLALLALFLVIALTFVFYAESEANSARLYREAQDSTGGPVASGGPPDPTGTLNLFLASLLFDTSDNNSDLTNALRGHSLAATMYGRIPGGGMYNGVGTFHETQPAVPPGVTPAQAPANPFTIGGNSIDRAVVVNYTNMPIGTTVNGQPAVVDFVYDPEWTGGYRLPGSGFGQTAPTLTNPQGRSYLPKNAPYTYPDLNNLFLASQSPVTGEIFAPSFFRPWHFNPGNPNGPNPSNPNLSTAWTRLAPWDPTGGSAVGSQFNTDWVNPVGRAKTLRPRPIDQLTQAEIQSAIAPATFIPQDINSLPMPQQLALFNLIDSKIKSGDIIPYPSQNADGSFTGDVQNLTSGVGSMRNDSILMDIGVQPKLLTVNNGKNGTKQVLVKPLVSVLIRDTDSQINVNAAGNIKNAGTHASYAGYGPWEINMAQAMGTAPATAGAVSGSKYTPVGSPTSVTGVTAMPYDRSGSAFGQYAQINWDATGSAGAPPIQVPSFVVPNPYQSDPVYGPNSAGFYDNNLAASKAQGHPSLFSANDWAELVPWATPSLNGTPFAYPLSDLRRLSLKYADTLDTYGQTTLAKLPARPVDIVGNTIYSNAKTYRIDPAHGSRMLFTTRSAQLVFPQFPGNFNALTSGSDLVFGLTAPPATVPALTYPFLPAYPLGTTAAFPTPGAAGGLAGGLTDFGTTDLRNQRSGLGPVDLNRPLTDYWPVNTAPTPGTPAPNLQQAWADRHNLARDIFARLIVAAGALAFVDPYSGNVVLPAVPAVPPTTTGSGYTQLTLPSYIVQTPAGSNVTFTVNGTPVTIPAGSSAYQAQTAVQTVYPGPVSVTVMPNGANIQYTVTFFNANANVQSTPTAAGPGVAQVTLPLTKQDYDAVRHLAQLAVNIVDYVDKDDISTLFIWNPPSNALTYTTNPATSFQAAGMIVANQMVFGTEKPKLVINEAYSELVNDPNEPVGMSMAPTKGARVRFWVELLNPTNTPYAGGASGPQGDGRAQLRYEAGAGPNMDGVSATYNAYKLTVIRAFKNSGNIPQTLQDPGNPLGDPNPTNNPSYNPDIDYDFSNYTGSPSTLTTTASRIVMPNNGVYVPNGPTQGVVLAGPSIPMPGTGTNPMTSEYLPAQVGTGAPPIAAPWTTAIFSQLNPAPAGANPQNAMEYYLTSTPVSGNTANQSPPQITSTDFQRHVVMLRRLANPYLPANDPTSGAFVTTLPANPYITVDYMDWVPAFDGLILTGTDTMPRSQKGMNPGTGFDPLVSRFSVGKVQPYAGWSLQQNGQVKDGTLSTTAYTFPNSFVLAQNPQSGPNQILHTFGRHNGVEATGPVPPTTPVVPPGSFTTLVSPSVALTTTGLPIGTTSTPPTAPETIMAPFDWLVHLDRPLQNQLELFQVRASKPHELSQLFVQPPINVTAQTLPASQLNSNLLLQKNLGLAPWLGVIPAVMDNTLTTTKLQPYPGFDNTADLTGTTSMSGNAPNLTHNGLYRALDLLRVKPWGYGEALGGRVYGRININTMQDRRVLSALLDPQGGNVFNAGDVNNLWAKWVTGVGGRTTISVARPMADNTTTFTSNVPFPGPTTDDLPAGGLFGYTTNSSAPTDADRPFKSFGVPEFSPGGMVMASGSGLQDTVLRLPSAPLWKPSTSYGVGQLVINAGNVYQCVSAGTSAPAAPGPTGITSPITDGLPTNPVVWNFYWPANQPYTWLLSQPNPYLQTEMVRKMQNNVTTVSNTFMVTMTIVYHQVRMNGNSAMTENNSVGSSLPVPANQQRCLLGPEVFLQTPGDMRQQFFMVIDRSNLAVTGGNIVSRPFYAAVDQPVFPGAGVSMFLSNAIFKAATPLSNSTLTVFADGQAVNIGTGTQLLVGTGASQESVTVAGFNANGSMIIAAMNYAHGTGEAVTTSVPGIPGSAWNAPTPPTAPPASPWSPTAPTAPAPQIDLWNNGGYNTSSSYRWIVPYFVQVN